MYDVPLDDLLKQNSFIENRNSVYRVFYTDTVEHRRTKGIENMFFEKSFGTERNIGIDLISNRTIRKNIFFDNIGCT